MLARTLDTLKTFLIFGALCFVGIILAIALTFYLGRAVEVMIGAEPES